MIAAVTENPFYILDVMPNASRADVERAGQLLASMLSVSMASAATYQTPVGRQPRTQELVRWALHQLRDPKLRAQHALWACLPLQEAAPATAPSPNRLPQALAAIGWDF